MSVRKSFSAEKGLSGLGGEEAECKEVNMRQDGICPFKVCGDKKVREKLNSCGRERVLFVFVSISQAV